MSYVLDALRKSETERRQGKVPDLGQQVQLIHRPKKRTSPVVWVALALLVNAGVLAVVFWPRAVTEPPTAPNTQAMAPEPEVQPATEPVPEPQPIETRATGALESQPAMKPEPVQKSGSERPTVITPSLRQERQAPVSSADGPDARVPHLVELPLSFQKRIPDLMFNSHIYSTDPNASRVMINGHYLRRGESFSGITIKNITREGVVLSKQGKVFRVGIVRDWVSPR